MTAIVGSGGKTTLMFALAAEIRANDGRAVITTTTTKIFPPRDEQSSNVVLSAGEADEVARALGPELEQHGHVTLARRLLPDVGKLEGLAPEVICRLAERFSDCHFLIEADGAAGLPLKAPNALEPVVPACVSRLVAVVGAKGLARPLDDRVVFRVELFSEMTGLAVGDEITPAAVALVIVSPRGLIRHLSQGAKATVVINQVDGPREEARARHLAEELSPSPEGPVDRVVLAALALGKVVDEIVR